MSDLSPEDLDEVKKSIYEKLLLIKDNTDDEQIIEKWHNFSEYIDSKNLKSDDAKADSGMFSNFINAFERDLDIDPGRLMGLTDGIFGMVMTLLVFGIALPEMQILTYADFNSFIFTLAPTIGITIVSFILISSFWVYHHEFIKLKNMNFPYLWINIFYLISISFIPFTTSLIGNYSKFFVSETLFGLNIFMTIICFLLMFYYAHIKGFLEKDWSKEDSKYIFNTFFIIMALTMVVNILDFNVSSNFIYLFLLVPVISTIRDIRFKT